MEMYDLLQCVDRALDQFGSNAKQSMYWALMAKEGVSSETIATKPEAFVRTLREVFGAEGSKVVERTIIEEIKDTFDLEKPSSSYTILEALDIAKRSITEVFEGTAVVSQNC